MRQELAVLLSTMQLLKEESPGRKIAEIQGQLATVLRARETTMPGHLPELPVLRDSRVGPGAGWTPEGHLCLARDRDYV